MTDGGDKVDRRLKAIEGALQSVSLLRQIAQAVAGEMTVDQLQRAASAILLERRDRAVLADGSRRKDIPDADVTFAAKVIAVILQQSHRQT